MEDYNPKEFIPTDSPIVNIECEEAWNLLSEKEKMYCYYLHKACWTGKRVCPFERSYESPALFILLKILFTQDMKELKETCMTKAGLSEEEWNQLIVYSAAVFNNAGNYKSFGDTKFVPQLEESKFLACLTNCQNYELYKEVVDTIWERISKEVYTEEEPYYKIGFHGEGESSSYYSSNISKQEAELMDRWLREQTELKHIIGPINTRVIKHDDGAFELLVHSTTRRHHEDKFYLKEYEFEGK
jgi:dipeptidyl-peptidase III